MTGPIDTHCPVHILQGLADPDVPHSHALKLVSLLPADDVTLSLIPDGDHRLSRPQDLDMLAAGGRRPWSRRRAEPMRISIPVSAFVAAIVGFGGTLALIIAAADAVGATQAQTASWVTALCLAMAVETPVAVLAHENAGHHRLVDAGRGADRRIAAASPWPTRSAPSSSPPCC